MIRALGSDDRLAVMRLLRLMHQETVYSRNEVNWTKVRDRLDMHCGGYERMAGFVGDLDGDVAGVLLVGCGENWFSEQLFGFDVVFYVRPDRRGMLLGRGLLRAFEAWGREKGCCQVSIGVSSGVMVERTGRMLERLGWGHSGGIYRRDL